MIINDVVIILTETSRSISLMFYLTQGKRTKNYSLIYYESGDLFKTHRIAKKTIKEALDTSNLFEHSFVGISIDCYIKGMCFDILFTFNTIQEFETQYPELLL